MLSNCMPTKSDRSATQGKDTTGEPRLLYNCIGHLAYDTCCVCSETYQYYNLPFCTPEGKEYKREGLGEVLEGDRLVTTPYDIKFKVNKDNELLCSQELTAKDLQKFRKAVKKDYYFQARF